MPVDNAVKNANNWELAHNPVYRDLQQQLIERTAERDAFRYAHRTPLALIFLTLLAWKVSVLGSCSVRWT